MKITFSQGQVVLIIVFSLAFSLINIFFILSPIRDKLIKIKELEYIYQALANSEKGLEVSLLDIFKYKNLDLKKEELVFYHVYQCGGLSYNNLSGNCFQTIYRPNFLSSKWVKTEDNFEINSFIFHVLEKGESIIFIQGVSDGFYKDALRSLSIKTRK